MESNSIQVTARCPIRTTLEMLGGKWKLLILFQLSTGTLRFAELKRRIPDISEKMLAQELHNLINSDLIDKQDYHEVPPRVEYALTSKGKLVLPLIEEMRNFALNYERFG
ncbi:helix-turn-helix domain-containing protein [Nibrella viscosa]|uniref:Helix-turn-helix domain-containing protein n=1 Tax=Nibrella viscosa TaxID=1084524 RepID=A0ABP8KTF7_9BACT